MLKVFDYNERVGKFDFFQRRPILHYLCATCSELPSYISTMGLGMVVAVLVVVSVFSSECRAVLRYPVQTEGITISLHILILNFLVVPKVPTWLK